jgi:hypothetical protein
MAAGSRSEYWQEMIRRQAGSGQSVHAFCVERHLTEQAFYYWRKRLSKETPVTFALVAADAANGKGAQTTALELDLGPGQRLRIPCGVDAATLRTVLSVLRERA